MKIKAIIIIVIVGLILGSIIYYNNQHISLWGVTVAQEDFSGAIIDMDGK